MVIEPVKSVTQQAAKFGEETERIDRRETVANSQRVLVLLATVKLAFLDVHLILFVSRTPDAVTDNAIGLRELPDNPVLATRRPARLYGRPQPNRLTDFELVHCCQS